MVIFYLIPISVLIISALAEWLHHVRIQKIARLAFGPTQKPTFFGLISPLIRVLMLTLLSWGLTVLLINAPKVHSSQITNIEPDKVQHLILIVDVSPSMDIKDSGSDGKLSRKQRAAAIVKSILSRLNQDYLHLSVIATYTTALPVVIDTRDLELVNSMLEDSPMYFAFKPGRTQLIEGIKVAANMAKAWRDGSTTVLMVSDGDTIPSTGMPKFPASVTDTIIAGVGDSTKGQFINGVNSRQDSSALSQIAARTGGIYHNANTKHLPTDTLRSISSLSTITDKNELTIREYALIAITFSTSILATLSLLLYFFGSRWKAITRKNNTRTT